MPKILIPLVFIILLIGGYSLYNVYFTGPSLVGLHRMADGTIMNADGETLLGAHTMPNGDIMLASGEVVGSIHLGTPFSTATEDLPPAKNEPEMVTLYDGDTYELTAGYVQKEVGNRRLRMLAYNGSVPGPIIKAEQGAEVTINFNNNTDVVQTVHSHGIRIDQAYDGTPFGTQDPVEPGESFTYKVRFPDAGVFWYHPHTREDYGQELGLYGNYIVEPSESSYWNTVNREVPLVVDDILIENEKIADFYSEVTNFALLGRYGNEHLVNGEVGYTLAVQKGEVIRFFVTNVANVRPYNLSIPGAKLKLVGADLGRYERETFVDSVLIAPAERAVLEVLFEKEGDYKLVHTDDSGKKELATFAVTKQVSVSYKATFDSLRTNGAVVKEFAPLKKYFYAEPLKELLLTIKLSGPKIDHSKHAHYQQKGEVTDTGLPNIQWNDPGSTDRMSTTEQIEWQLLDLDTRKVSMNIDDWNFKVGDLVKVSIQNDPNAEHVMQHPVHFHGQRFVVLDRNGVPNDNYVWKDTTLVYPGETVNILVEMTNPGEWMAHCHISEHLHAGMMMNFKVANGDGTVPGDEYRKTVSEHTQH
jgi:FtsP/CotA-like multicopper oxidase with cupredoxin domain